jgi:hypothetical protein
MMGLEPTTFCMATGRGFGPFTSLGRIVEPETGYSTYSSR